MSSLKPKFSGLVLLLSLFALVLASPRHANAQTATGVIDVNGSHPNFFECTDGGTLSASAYYEWNVYIDGGLVYSSGKIPLNGSVNLVDDGFYGSGGPSSGALHGTHTCRFECAAMEPFPAGMTTIWDTSKTYTFP